MKKLFLALMLFTCSAAAAQVREEINLRVKGWLQMIGAKPTAISTDSTTDYPTGVKLYLERPAKAYARKAAKTAIDTLLTNYRLSGSVGTYGLAYNKGDTAWHTVALDTGSGISINKTVDVNGDTVYKISSTSLTNIWKNSSTNGYSTSNPVQECLINGFGTITVPANTIQVGSTYEFNFNGYYSTDAVSTNIYVRFLYGTKYLMNETIIVPISVSSGTISGKLIFTARTLSQWSVDGEIFYYNGTAGQRAYKQVSAIINSVVTNVDTNFSFISYFSNNTSGNNLYVSQIQINKIR